MYQNSMFLWCKLLKPHTFSSPQNVFSNLCCRSKSRSSRSLRLKVDQVIGKKAPSDEVFQYSLFKPTIYTAAVFGASFSGAAIWQYENMRKRAREIIRAPQKWMVQKFDPSKSWLQERFGRNKMAKQGSLRHICNTYWNSLSAGQKLFVPILCINVLVYGCWKVPALSGVMLRFFVSNPASKHIYLPMLLSNYSHNGGLHLALNMFVLNSFISTIVDSMGAEQFIAFYVTSGVCASLLSHVYRCLTKQPSMSLGASGAIMGVISYICFKFPDIDLAILFLPFFTFKAKTGIVAIMTFDFVGILAKFRIFDHAAHLGGALFGMFWCLYGTEHIWQKRGPLLEWWHKQRNRWS